MKCIKCDSTITEDNIYCPKCGTMVALPSTQPANPSPVKLNKIRSINFLYLKPMALILLLVLVVSMIVLAVYFLPRRSDPILDRGNNREFNSLIQMNEDVNGKWWKVETQYQRRSDIVPNLVNSVKEYAKYEQKILAEVIEARSKVSKMSITKEVLDDPQAFQNFAQAQSQLSGALSRLMIAVEKYPDLKANENFKNQMVQLEGTENRISVARIDFNTVVQKYNEQIKEYPETARMHDFNIKQFFHGEYGSEESNKVRF